MMGRLSLRGEDPIILAGTSPDVPVFGLSSVRPTVTTDDRPPAFDISAHQSIKVTATLVFHINTRGCVGIFHSVLRADTSRQKSCRYKKAFVMAGTSGGGADDQGATNKPRNHVVTDASQPYTYTFKQYGKPASVVVDQTPEEETWPGGALWDIGVLLSHVFVGLAGFELATTKQKLPVRLLEAFPTSSTKDASILELGCGVGLTGIVAAAVLGTQLTVLTDLKVVVDQVAEPNMVKNSTSSTNKQPYRLTEMGKRGRIMSQPLAWGVEAEEQAVEDALVSLVRPPKVARKQKKGKASSVKDMTKPDIIIIGDVAYQHKPGAPSHFDALLSTVLRFLGEHTLVVFGTRMRMPASKDLLEMFSEHMEEIVQPPVGADEIDPSFGVFKHQITIHVFKQKQT